MTKYYLPASSRRRNAARLCGFLVMLGAVGAALLPLIDSGFAPFGELPLPWIVSGVLFFAFLVVYAAVIARKGALPGLGTMGVKAVRVDDGRDAGVVLVQKYAIECAVAILTFFFGFLVVLHLTRDEQGRTWFDRLVGVIYVDTRTPMETQEDIDEASSSVNPSHALSSPQSKATLQRKTTNPQLPLQSSSHVGTPLESNTPAMPPILSAPSSMSTVLPHSDSITYGMPNPMQDHTMQQSSSLQGSLLSQAVSPSLSQAVSPSQPEAPLVDPLLQAPMMRETGYENDPRAAVPHSGGEFSARVRGGAPVGAPVVQLDFTDGTSQILEGTLVIGRNPALEAQRRAATPYKVEDPRKSISKTHVALTARGSNVLVEDLNSTNGTVVITSEGKPVPVRAGQMVVVEDGASVVFGDMRVKVRIR